ncbi:MAG TPA: TIGR03560 family F420-dependent LLM class oxidoreductase [Acidimicrobiia bacterium]|nr:TIGR03560 family F420-dependent LLM class oxidoreductase [Acidimicrobiia bacterium]
MSPRFGVHTGLQHTSIPELRELWARIETIGFDWISIWDHFYAADNSGDPQSLEAVASQTALAASTTRVTCGSLVYSAGYRHPAVLANAVATMDQVANGRIALGLGAGWLQNEYDVYGLRFGSAGERLRMLEEYVQCVRGLLTQEHTSFEGEFFQLRNAMCEPKPVQERLPIWIGGGGEKVTLRIAAQHADAWNVPFVPPKVWARKSAVLDEWCAKIGRDPASITRAVNVGMAFTDEALRIQFGPMADAIKPGVLTGSVQEMVDKVGAYVDAGAQWVIVAMRAPFDRDGLEQFAADVIPAVRG